MQKWTKFEISWLFIFTTIQIILFFWQQQKWLDLICALSNMLCLVLVAKGRLSNFFFGMVATSIYAYISYQQQLYGETMLNSFFYFPMQFIGLYFWFKHQNKNTKNSDIIVKKLNLKHWLIVLGTIACCSFGYAELLAHLNAQQVHLDSLNVVICIAAQILMTLRYTEQWLLWIISNILGLILWINVGDHSMVMMNCAALVNSLYGYYHWNKQTSSSV